MGERDYAGDQHLNLANFATVGRWLRELGALRAEGLLLATRLSHDNPPVEALDL